ncbi:MAG: hypothetical protein ACK4L7_09085 [Flavobacteriales bacterium]
MQNRISEGIIEYALSFPDYDPNGLMASMLPEKTTLCFNDARQAIEVSAGMGLFRTFMVIDNEAHGLHYHLSMMGKGLVSELRPRDLDLFNSDYGRPTILYTADVDTIAGYPCRRALAIFNRLEQREIELWYTDRIAMPDPNWFGPFAEVPGVLMRYEIVQNGIRMQLQATSVKAVPVEAGRFEPKGEYQKVSAEVLHHELDEVMGSFSM